MPLLRGLPIAPLLFVATAAMAGDLDSNWLDVVTPDTTIAEMIPCLNVNPAQREDCVAHIDGMTSFEYDAMVRGCGIITPKEEAANCGAALAKLKPQFVTGVTPDLPPLTPGEVAAIGAGCAAMSVYAPNDRCVSGHRKLKAIILKGKLGAVVSGQQ